MEEITSGVYIGVKRKDLLTQKKLEKEAIRTVVVVDEGPKKPFVPGVKIIECPIFKGKYIEDVGEFILKDSNEQMGDKEKEQYFKQYLQQKDYVKKLFTTIDSSEKNVLIVCGGWWYNWLRILMKYYKELKKQ